MERCQFMIMEGWIKQSIFQELPYWKTNLIRHNLDVMHIGKKNVFDNVFNTMMDVKVKPKILERCSQIYMNIAEDQNLNFWIWAMIELLNLRLSTNSTFIKNELYANRLSNLNLPNTYVSNLSRCIDIREGKLFRMKSHNCHVFLECLLSITFNVLPDQVWSHFIGFIQFFQDIYSITLREQQLVLLE